MLSGLFQAEALGATGLALFQVVMIDLVLAGDNAVAIGMVAAGLERRRRRRVILLGLTVAVAMRIGLALIATVLLGLIGLLLAGGALWLWVCWKLAQELRSARAAAAAAADTGAKAPARPVSFRSAFVKILVADLSMSLDNVLGVAGAAHDRPMVLAFGLLLSIGLTGLAAAWIAKAMSKRPWIGYIGLAIMVYVAGGMIWQGHRDLVIDLGETPAYNQAMPSSLLDIGAREIARRRAR
jgi:YjbE family integral membrane protein